MGRPRRRLTPPQYVAAGKEAILDLLRTEHAATWAEAQAKVGDRPWRDDLPAVDPHHLTTARRELFLERRITESIDTYRGREIGVLHLTDLKRRQTAFKKAAARKRQLAARFLGWASSSQHFPGGAIGAGGEAVVHASLLAASHHGYRVLRPEGGDISSLLGAPVPGGPLDNAAFLQTLTPQGLPRPLILVAVEVKNVRHWLYPPANEIYQLLSKAARLRVTSGDIDILPVLICRRRHYLTYQFARALGFLAFETGRQFIHPRAPIASAKLREVQVELGFSDLTVSDAPDPGLVRLFSETCPRYGHEIAARWTTAGSLLADHYEILRRPLTPPEEASAMEALREEMEEREIFVEW